MKNIGVEIILGIKIPMMMSLKTTWVSSLFLHDFLHLMNACSLGLLTILECGPLSVSKIFCYHPSFYQF